MNSALILMSDLYNVECTGTTLILDWDLGSDTLIDWLIDFYGMSIILGLFYA